MNTYRHLITYIALLIPHFAVAQITPPPPSPNEKSVVESGNAFALDLYQQLNQQSGNIFFSPASISTALAMTYAGARGDTATQMAQTMHFTLEPQAFHPAMGALLRRTTAGNALYELREGNALWLQKGFPFLPAFLKLTQDDYAASLEHVDFLRATEAARLSINQRVEQQTHGKIKNLLPGGTLTPDTRLVLTNAIYFKGDWVMPFEPRSTATADFHVTSDRNVPAPFMHHQAAFKYYDGGTFQVLALPYKSADLSMVVFLPKDNAGLAPFEQSLTAANMTAWLAALEKPVQQVNVALPKFKATLQFDLTATLQKMGMRLAFEPAKADFSGMTSRAKLSISAVEHKAYVAVDENGSEAAAATAVVMRAYAMLPPTVPPIIFRADHPFVFLIRDNRTGSILFLGRVTDPSHE